MAVSNINALVYGLTSGDGVRKIQLPVNNSTFPILQGEMVYWDSTAKIIKALDSDAHAANYRGIALQPSAVSSNLDNSGAPKVQVVQTGSELLAIMNTTAGDTITPGDALYFGADSQTVTNTAGGQTHVLGYAQLSAGITTLAGGVGIQVQMLITAKLLSV